MSECATCGKSPITARGLCHTHWQAYRSRMIAYGKWEPVKELQDVEPVVEYLNELRKAGLGVERISKLSGIPGRTILAMRAHRSQCEVRVADAIFSVPIPRSPHGPEVAEGAFIPRCGTQRRLQALAAMGWTVKALGERLGWKFQYVWDLQTGEGMVTAGTARKVAKLFEELEATPGPSKAVRTKALKRGWFPPLAWDEGVIDDPWARPVTAKSKTMRFPERYAEMREIGLTDRQIAERMGIKYGSLEDSLRRYDMPVSDELRSLAYEEAA